MTLEMDGSHNALYCMKYGGNWILIGYYIAMRAYDLPPPPYSIWHIPSEFSITVFVLHHVRYSRPDSFGYVFWTFKQEQFLLENW